MEEDTLEKCIKLLKAYKRLVNKEPNASKEYVMSKVTEAADIYIDTLRNNEFSKELIGRVVYRIAEIETLRDNR